MSGCSSCDVSEETAHAEKAQASRQWTSSFDLFLRNKQNGEEKKSKEQDTRKRALRVSKTLEIVSHALYTNS